MLRMAVLDGTHYTLQGISKRQGQLLLKHHGWFWARGALGRPGCWVTTDKIEAQTVADILKVKGV